MQTNIAIDAMGGDHGPSVTIPAALQFLERSNERTVLLVGKPEVLKSELGRLKALHWLDAAEPRLKIIPASEVVGMDEDIRSAIRNKKDSSMRVAIDLVKSGAAHACVSAGNTGALMGTAKFVLKTLPGIDRPAICDGFIGNVMLKTSEGIAKMMGDFLKEEYTKNIFRKLAALASYAVINGFRKRVDHRRYNGAALLGLQGVVVKSHGSADAYSFHKALERAASEVEHGLLALIGKQLERLHAEGLLLPQTPKADTE